MPNRDGKGPRQQSPNPSKRGGGRRRGDCFNNYDNTNIKKESKGENK